MFSFQYQAVSFHFAVKSKKSADINGRLGKREERRLDIHAIYFHIQLKDSLPKVTNSQEIDFGEWMNQVTGGKIAEEIHRNYNVVLDVGSTGSYQQIIDSYDIRCKNYVRISPKVLSKMEKDPALKKKVLSEIAEFCSPQQQAKVNALQPPVKSAGMMIYPDGSTLYWLEGYPNDLGNEKNKKIIVGEQSLDKLCWQYRELSVCLAEEDIQTAMQILATGCAEKRTEWRKT